MTPEQFCYWLQGRAELMPETPPTAAEWKMIGEHLATVFKKVTPPLQQPAPARSPSEWEEAIKRGAGTPLVPQFVEGKPLVAMC